jgi:hypothetical protein
MNLVKVGKSIAATVALLAALAPACDVGNEGERCNPLLSHDECGAGLACTQPVDCPEAYCCPTSGSSSNPYCQPGCNGGLAAICAADPTAGGDCGTDASPSPAPDADAGGD